MKFFKRKFVKLYCVFSRRYCCCFFPVFVQKILFVDSVHHVLPHSNRLMNIVGFCLPMQKTISFETHLFFLAVHQTG